MTKRIVTGVILIVLALVVTFVQGWIFQLGFLALMLMSVHEMFAAFKNKGMKPVKWPAYAFCILSVLNVAVGEKAMHINLGAEGTLYAMTVCMLAAMIAVILRGRVDFEAMSASVLPMLYPGLLYVCILKLAELDGRMLSTLAVAMTFFIASMNDCFALFTGMLLGKHKLSPEISPKKTVEGAVGGLVASVVFGVLLPYAAELIVTYVPAAQPYAQELPPLWIFGVLGLFMGALSQFGDLTASMVKRHCGVKDFGRIFPGHGGVMDRMDGILFSGAACYIFFRLMGI